MKKVIGWLLFLALLPIYIPALIVCELIDLFRYHVLKDGVPGYPQHRKKVSR